METLAASATTGCFDIDWSPCSLSPEFKDRFCPYARMAPGLLTMIANIIAIICALVWNSPYLCIAYIPGCFASGYLMYLGWDFQHLQSFGESNVELKSSISVLEKEVDTYKKVNGEMETKLTSLEKVKTGLEEAVESFTSENLDLKMTAEKLQGVNSTLETSANLHVEHLTTLKESIGGFQNATKLNHSELSGHISTFQQTIGELEKKSSSFESTGNAIETKMKEHTQILLEAAQSLTQIFSEINAWKDQAAVKERMETLQAMNATATKLASQSGAQEAQLKALKEREVEQRKIIQEQKDQIEGLGSEITNLRQIKSGFDSTLADFQDVAGRLESTESFLSPQTKKMSARVQRRDNDETD